MTNETEQARDHTVPSVQTEAEPKVESVSSQISLSERDSFLIDCLRNIRYHEDRERFFSRLHKLSMFVVVASSTASFAFVRAVPYLTAAITLAGLVDLVFDVSGKARLHASLRRRFFDVLARLEGPGQKLEPLKEQAVQIYADEPPCMHAANTIAYNGAMEFLGRPHSFQYKLMWYHRVFRNVFAFAATDFKTLGEAATSGQRKPIS